MLRQVLEGRLARLGEAARELLTVAAVIGQDVPLALWARVGAVAEEALLDVVERAVGAHLLFAPADGASVGFVHALVREALYEGLLPPRRRGWHWRIAEALLAAPAPDPDAVAYHLQRAGDPRAVEWLVRASDRAYRAYAWLSAAERAEAALALLEQHGGDPAERGWLCVRLARLRRMGDQRQALAYAERALTLAEESGDRALAAYARSQVAFLRCRLGRLRDGLAALATVFDDTEALPPEEQARLAAWRVVLGDWSPAQSRSTLALWLVFPGQYAEATALAERLLAADAAEPTADRSQSCLALGVAAANLGQPDASARWFAEAHTLNRAAGDHWGLGQFHFLELLHRHLPYRADWPGEGAHLAAEAEAAWRRAAGAIRADAPPGLARLPLMPLAGEWDAARELALGVRAGGGVNVPNVLGLLGPLALARGEADLARALVRETLPGGPMTEPGDCFFRTGTALQRVAAALAFDAGDLPEAHAWLAAHDRWLAWSGTVLGRAEGALGWAEYHRAGGDLAAARRAAEAALAHATEPRQPLSLLAARRILGELDTADGRYPGAAEHLDAALALADACAAPYERALTLLALAELRAATADSSGTRTLLAAVCALCTPLGAAPALARAGALAARLDTVPAAPARVPAGLTPREAEVLRLLAGGASNRAIADTLFLSLHTVERHVANLYAKTGAHGRAAATAFAHRHRLA